MLLNDCLSDLTLDAWQAGEISEAQPLEQHVVACARCRQRRQALLEQAQAFERRSDRALPLVRVRAELSRRKRRKQLASLSLAAVAALGLLVFQARAPEVHDGRLKGPGAIGFYVRRAEQVFRWQPGQAVYPGDQLRFTWRSERPVYVAIFSLDSRGRASVYFPSPGAAQQRVPAGEEVDLPLAVRLDDSVGVEQLYALACDSPPALEDTRLALERERTVRAAASCEVLQLALRKEPRP